MYKFEKLRVWQAALGYIDLIYEIGAQLPRSEEYNLRSQMQRAATSIALNTAEGSTGQTDAEQARFLGLALRSLIETVACQHLISRRKYLADPEVLREAYRQSEALSRQLQTMRKAIAPGKSWVREEALGYGYEMMDDGPWTMDDGRWTTGGGGRVTDGLSSVVRGLRSVSG